MHNRSGTGLCGGNYGCYRRSQAYCRFWRRKERSGKGREASVWRKSWRSTCTNNSYGCWTSVRSISWASVDRKEFFDKTNARNAKQKVVNKWCSRSKHKNNIHVGTYKQIRKKYFLKRTLEIFYVQTVFCIYLLQYLRMKYRLLLLLPFSLELK